MNNSPPLPKRRLTWPAKPGRPGANSARRPIGYGISRQPWCRPPAFFEQLKTLNNRLAGLRESLYGDPIRSAKNESTAPSAAGKIWSVISGHWGTTQLPTATQQQAIDLAGQELGKLIEDYAAFEDELTAFETALVRAGAPYTPGRKID